MSFGPDSSILWLGHSPRRSSTTGSDHADSSRSRATTCGSAPRTSFPATGWRKTISTRSIRLPASVSAGSLMERGEDRKSTRLDSRHDQISYAVFCLEKKKPKHTKHNLRLTSHPTSL